MGQSPLVAELFAGYALEMAATPSVTLRAGNALDDYRQPSPFESAVDSISNGYLKSDPWGINYLDPSSWRHYLPSVIKYALPRFTTLVVAIALLPAIAGAAGGTGRYELPWQTPGELLEYRSCGCADSCWVAEVRTKRARVLRARLRCDCERLFLARGTHGKEQMLSQNCPGPEDDKAKFIADTLRRSIGAGDAAP